MDQTFVYAVVEYWNKSATALYACMATNNRQVIGLKICAKLL